MLFCRQRAGRRSRGQNAGLYRLFPGTWSGLPRAQLKALRERFAGKSGFNLAGNETAVWVELQLGHPHDPNVPAKHLSLRARLGKAIELRGTTSKNPLFDRLIKSKLHAICSSALRSLLSGTRNTLGFFLFLYGNGQ